MQIELVEAHSHTVFCSATLRHHAESSKRTRITKHFVATYGNTEVAFLSLDFWGGKECFFLYELLVDPPARRLGYGAAIVKKCVSLATQDGYKAIRLKPYSLERGGSENELREWYAKLGFSQCPDQADLMEIVLG